MSLVRLPKPLPGRQNQLADPLQSQALPPLVCPWRGTASLGPLQHSGRKSLPPPDITFPLARLNLEYQHGDPVHQLEDENA